VLQEMLGRCFGVRSEEVPVEAEERHCQEDRRVGEAQRPAK
jgi:hypothetical protein